VSKGTKNNHGACGEEPKRRCRKGTSNSKLGDWGWKMTEKKRLKKGRPKEATTRMLYHRKTKKKVIWGEVGGG